MQWLDFYDDTITGGLPRLLEPSSRLGKATSPNSGALMLCSAFLNPRKQHDHGSRQNQQYMVASLRTLDLVRFLQSVINMAQKSFMHSQCSITPFAAGEALLAVTCYV